MYFEKTELTSYKFKKPEGTLGKDWHVFDDHVSIDQNVIEQKDGSFTLRVCPVGKVRILFAD